ncbi:MAG: hypothetical protein LBH56_00690, partial [Coriobacteriales bacterium]|nr:hypothetical protein [Coriobacteriales bacterium]
MSDFSQSTAPSSELLEPCGRLESSRPSWRNPSGVLRHYGRRLGFLRLLQVYFASIVVLNVVALLFLSHGQIVFVFGDYLGFTDAIFSGVVVWLIMRRKRLARPFVCIGSLVIFTLSVADTLMLVNAGTSLATSLTHLRVMSLPVALYFFFSRRVRATLTCPFDH